MFLFGIWGFAELKWIQGCLTKFGNSAFWDCESDCLPQSCDERHIPTTIANQTTQGFGIWGSSLVGDDIRARTNSTLWHESLFVKMLCIYTELVCSGHHRKVRILDDLKHKPHSSGDWKPRSGCQQGGFFQQLFERISSMPLTEFLVFADSLWVPWLVEACPQSLPSSSHGGLPLRVCECMSPNFPFLEGHRSY